MSYIHVTCETNALKIINEGRIEAYGLSIEDLLENYLDRLFMIVKNNVTEQFIERMGELKLFDLPKYLYLGPGIYCFKEDDDTAAIEYGQRYVKGNPMYVKIKTNGDYTMSDLNVQENFNCIKEYLENEFIEQYCSLYPNLSKEARLSLELITQIILYQLQKRYDEDFQPFIIGVSLDIYREFSDQKYDVYSYRFLKRTSDYVIIKNKDIIDNVELLYC